MQSNSEIPIVSHRFPNVDTQMGMTTECLLFGIWAPNYLVNDKRTFLLHSLTFPDSLTRSSDEE